MSLVRRWIFHTTHIINLFFPQYTLLDTHFKLSYAVTHANIVYLLVYYFS